MRRVDPRIAVPLAAILLVATALRFAGASFGLRHTPFIDEAFFVRNVEGMLNRGDLDHRFHMYPGFFFYLLLPVLAWAPRPFGAEAYLLGRYVTAGFGVATVWLAYLLGSRLAGPRAGLGAAALMAVSPVPVFYSHEVRPDLALGFFALVALLMIDRLDDSWRRNVASGIGVGMATAVKFTGVALAACYAARRMTIAGGRWRGIILAAASSVLTYAVLSPYSFLHFDAFRAGASDQLAYHRFGESLQSAAANSYTYAVYRIPQSLGLPGVLLAAAGLWLRRELWQRLLPLIVLPVVLIALLSTGEIGRSRYVISSLGAVAVLAGVGLDAIWRRSPRLAAAWLLLALAAPAQEALADVATFRKPGTMDRALDWMEANFTDGGRVLTNLPRLGLDRTRFELKEFEKWGAVTDRIATHADVVVATPPGQVPHDGGFVTALVVEPAYPSEGPSIEVLVPAGPRPWQAVSAGLRFDASENPESLSLMADGNAETRWQTEGPPKPGTWIEVLLPKSQVVESIELFSGTRKGHPRENLVDFPLEVTAFGDGGARLIPVVAARPDASGQVSGPLGPSQLLVFVEPTRLTRLRITTTKDGAAWNWGIAELTVRVLSTK